LTGERPVEGIDVSGGRVPNAVHERRGWVIPEVAHDFKLLDVWALPVEGTANEFQTFIEMMASFDPLESGNAASRSLFRIRLHLGAWLRLDDHEKARPIPGCTETTLAARLPDQLRGSATRPGVGDTLRFAGFVPLYRTDVEWAAEVSNATVHGILHFGWVAQETGLYRPEMAIYVKPRGRLGDAYMMLIEPFRHLIVYPALIRQVAHIWDARAA
jgi:hypothetical protein